MKAPVHMGYVPRIDTPGTVAEQAHFFYIKIFHKKFIYKKFHMKNFLYNIFWSSLSNPVAEEDHFFLL